MQGLKRVMGGGGLFLTHYEATQGAGMVTFAAKLPGHILPTDIVPGQAFFVHRHGWLCGTPGITPSIGLQQTFRGGIWGGDGFILQKLEGQGRAWIELSGELVHYTLAPGQTLMVHPGHVGMFEGSVQFTMTLVPGIANMAFGADGFQLVALTGPGQIWLQSMPLPVLAHGLRAVPRPPGRSAGGRGGRDRWHHRQHHARTVTKASLLFRPNEPRSCLGCTFPCSLRYQAPSGVSPGSLVTICKIWLGR